MLLLAAVYDRQGLDLFRLLGCLMSLNDVCICNSTR